MIPNFAVVSCICLVAFMLVKFCRMFAVMKFFPPSNSLVQKTLNIGQLRESYANQKPPAVLV